MTVFIQESEVTAQFPQHYTALIKVTGLMDRSCLLQPTERMKQEIVAGAGAEKIERACEAWRAVFEKMGAKPKYKSSLASLCACFKERGKLYEINEIVDFYNHYSLRSANPMGAYDLDRLEGDLRLAFVGKGRPFLPLGNPKSPQMTKDKEVGYADAGKVTCRYWNLQDCDETKVTETTRNILFIFDLTADGSEFAAGQYRQLAADFNEVFAGLCQACGITGQGLTQEVSFG
jgi:DNA/RNA-binding domain of Phe-tRNA-synthetase-like protein